MSATRRDVEESEIPSGVLLEAILRGENGAWDRLCRQIREILKAVARKRLRTDTVLADPSDCVQKALTKAYKGRPRFRGTRLVQFYSWLTRIVINQANTDNRARPTPGPLPNGSGSEIVVPVPIQEESETNTEIDRLRSALKRLPDAQREAVRLRKLERWSVQQIADHLDRSKEATAGLIKRGMVRLSELMHTE